MNPIKNLKKFFKKKEKEKTPDEQWSQIALPLVRRVFPQIVSKNFVSVQPMSMPSGNLFGYGSSGYATAGGFSSSGTIGGWNFNPSDFSTQLRREILVNMDRIEEALTE